MLQTVLVGVILAVTAFFTVRWLVRTLKGKGGGCGCGCRNCPHARNCNDYKIPDISFDDK